MMQIPFHKAYIEDDDIQGVVDAIKSGWLTMGPKTVEFENKFKEAVKSPYAVAVNSCTAAMHLALKTIGIQEKDEVIIPAMTFTATGEVVRYFNAIPRIVDVNRDSENILPEAIEMAISDKAKAVIPVHIAGEPADLDEILNLCRNNDLKIIEDAAHCFPSYYKGKPIGSIGDITTFSFYATKTIACGEGGMATTAVEEYAESMRMLRLHGISRDAWKRYSAEGSWYYEVVEAGYKYNTTDLQAALGLTQLAKAEEIWKKRQKIAEKYNRSFTDIEQLIIPDTKPDRQSSWHLYILKLNIESLTIGRDEFISHLEKRGIKTSVHFIPLYRHPYYQKNFSLNISDYPNSEWLFKRIISLPIYPGMQEKEIDYVIENVLELAKIYAK